MLDFSVIVPTRDRPERLAVFFQSLSALDYPRGAFEVIVVDDGSRMSLEEVAAPFRKTIGLHIFRTTGIGPGPARNHGAARARGKWLAFTDDDCAAAPDWLKRLRAHLEAAPGRLIGGHVKNALPGNVYAAAWHTITHAGFEYYDPGAGRAHAFPSSNLAMSAAQFHQLGGFAPEWSLAAAEDREFCWRWLRRSWEMNFAPDAVVWHHRALDFRSFCEIYFRYGRGAYLYHQRRGETGGAGGLQADWRFYWHCFQRPFRTTSFLRALPLALLLGLWQILNAAGYFAERRRQRAEVSLQRAGAACSARSP